LKDCVKFCLLTSENVKIFGRIENRFKTNETAREKALRHELSHDYLHRKIWHGTANLIRIAN